MRATCRGITAQTANTCYRNLTCRKNLSGGSPYLFWWRCQLWARGAPHIPSLSCQNTGWSYTHTLTHTHTSRSDTNHRRLAMSVGSWTPPEGKVTKLELSYYLLVALAPGPAQAFENMHCHLASFRSLQRVPDRGCHPLLPLCSSTPLFNTAPPLVWLFWNNLIPPEAAAERRECSWTGQPFTSRAPRSPPPLPCALRAPWPSQAGESYVTGCYVIAADRVLLCVAQLRNIIPRCCYKFPPH